MTPAPPPPINWLHRLLLPVAVCRPHLLLPAWLCALSGAHWASSPSSTVEPLQTAGAVAAWSLALAASHVVNLITDQTGDQRNRKNLFWHGLLSPRDVAIVGGAASLAALLGSPVPG